MKKMLAIALVAGSVSGCASIMSGSSQSVSVASMNAGTIDASSTCTLANKKGSWVTTGGGSVTARKSSDDLNVTCKDNETAAVGMQNAPRSTLVPMLAPAAEKQVMIEMPGDIVLEEQVGPMSVVTPVSAE